MAQILKIEHLAKTFVLHQQGAADSSFRWPFG